MQIDREANDGSMISELVCEVSQERLGTGLAEDWEFWEMPDQFFFFSFFPFFFSVLSSFLSVFPSFFSVLSSFLSLVCTVWHCLKSSEDWDDPRIDLNVNIALCPFFLPHFCSTDPWVDKV